MLSNASPPSNSEWATLSTWAFPLSSQTPEHTSSESPALIFNDSPNLSLSTGLPISNDDNKSPMSSTTPAPSLTSPHRPCVASLIDISTPLPAMSRARSVKAPRAPNCFMLFRSDFIKTGRVPKAVECRQQNISKIAGECWGLMSDEEKLEWREKAAHVALEHSLKHPSHKSERWSRSKPRQRAQVREDPEEAQANDRIREIREKYCGALGPAPPPSRRRRAKSSRRFSQDRSAWGTTSLPASRAVTPSTVTCSPFDSPLLPPSELERMSRPESRTGSAISQASHRSTPANDSPSPFVRDLYLRRRWHPVSADATEDKTTVLAFGDPPVPAKMEHISHMIPFAGDGISFIPRVEDPAPTLLSVTDVVMSKDSGSQDSPDQAWLAQFEAFNISLLNQSESLPQITLSEYSDGPSNPQMSMPYTNSFLSDPLFLPSFFEQPYNTSTRTPSELEGALHEHHPAAGSKTRLHHDASTS